MAEQCGHVLSRTSLTQAVIFCRRGPHVLSLALVECFLRLDKMRVSFQDILRVVDWLFVRDDKLCAIWGKLYCRLKDFVVLDGGIHGMIILVAVDLLAL